MSPSITLTPNSINPQLNQGTAGNPALRPMRATNVDLAAEADFGAGHAASMTLFWKRVDGFIATLSQPETHDGTQYQVSRPYNADAGRIRRQVLGDGARLLGLGLVLGVLAAVSLGFVLRSQLFGVGAIDLPSLAIVVVVLAVTALVACWLPARRAARSAPLDALRYE